MDEDGPEAVLADVRVDAPRRGEDVDLDGALRRPLRRRGFDQGSQAAGRREHESHRAEEGGESSHCLSSGLWPGRRQHIRRGGRGDPRGRPVPL